jgi:hypothetical protein
MNKKPYLMFLLCLALILAACAPQQEADLGGSADVSPPASVTFPPEPTAPPSAKVETAHEPLADSNVTTPQTDIWGANSLPTQTRWISEVRRFGNVDIWVNMQEPAPFPDKTHVLKVKIAGVVNTINMEDFLSTLQLSALPAGFSVNMQHEGLLYGPSDSMEIDIAPVPVGDYPEDLTGYADPVYRLSEWSQPIIWTADQQAILKAANAGVLAQHIAQNLGVSTAAPSVLYRTPLLDGRMATALFLPYLLRGLPMQSEHTVHDNWREAGGREWGYVPRQGMRITVLDDGQVYRIDVPPSPVETGVLDAEPKFISWSDALVYVMASANIRSLSPGATGFALVAARTCFVLNPIPGSFDEYEAVPAYEMCFRFYDRGNASQLEQFLSVWSFYVDARTGKVFRR